MLRLGLWGQVVTFNFSSAWPIRARPCAIARGHCRACGGRDGNQGNVSQAATPGARVDALAANAYHVAGALAESNSL